MKVFIDASVLIDWTNQTKEYLEAEQIRLMIQNGLIEATTSIETRLEFYCGASSKDSLDIKTRWSKLSFGPTITPNFICCTSESQNREMVRFYENCNKIKGSLVGVLPGKMDKDCQHLITAFYHSVAHYFITTDQKLINKIANEGHKVFEFHDKVLRPSDFLVVFKEQRKTFEECLDLLDLPRETASSQTHLPRG